MVEPFPCPSCGYENVTIYEVEEDGVNGKYECENCGLRKHLEVSKYRGLTPDKFREILEDIVNEMSTDEILSYGDVYSILSEELNNEILDRYKRQQEAKEE